MTTFVPTQADINRNWHVIDADSKILGRIATVAAQLLQGKHKPRYTPFLDLGDHVIIVNAEKVRLTGRKEEHKVTWRIYLYMLWATSAANRLCGSPALAW